MRPVRNEKGKVWAFLTIRDKYGERQFGLYECTDCGLTIIQRIEVETKKN